MSSPISRLSTRTYRLPPALAPSGVGEAALNYLGQLRLYSYADLLLLLLALGASAAEIVQCSLLWFGFLIFLEWLHRDRGRLAWPWYAWAAPWAAAATLDPTAALAPFFAVAIAYSHKKRFSLLAAVSPLLNGAIKGTLVVVIAPDEFAAIALVTAVTALRNLAGDFRDVVKDRTENVATLPVRLGLAKDMPVLYPLSLLATSILWTAVGSLSVWYLAGAIAIQAATYRLTPR